MNIDFISCYFPNSHIRSNSFLVESIGFSMNTIMSSVNNDSVASFCLIWMLFISFFFFCLITVARTSNTMLNRSGESGCPCLFPDLSGKAFSFCPFSMMLAVGCFVYDLHYVEECSLYSHFAKCFFIING